MELALDFFGNVLSFIKDPLDIFIGLVVLGSVGYFVYLKTFKKENTNLANLIGMLASLVVLGYSFEKDRFILGLVSFLIFLNFVDLLFEKLKK